MQSTLEKNPRFRNDKSFLITQNYCNTFEIGYYKIVFLFINCWINYENIEFQCLEVAFKSLWFFLLNSLIIKNYENIYILKKSWTSKCSDLPVQ